MNWHKIGLTALGSLVALAALSTLSGTASGLERGRSHQSFVAR